MKAKNSKGFVGVDMVVSVVAILAFSGLIVTLMYNNYLENVKIKKGALATIYLTEIFENVGIASFDEVTQSNVDNFIPAALTEDHYQVDITVNSYTPASSTTSQDIMKKINATITYTISNKEYKLTMERAKIKE